MTWLVGALLLEQNDEWRLQRQYMQLHGLQGPATIHSFGCPQSSTDISSTAPRLTTRTARAGTQSCSPVNNSRLSAVPNRPLLRRVLLCL